RLLLKPLQGYHLNRGFCCSLVFGWQYPVSDILGLRYCGDEKNLRFEGIPFSGCTKLPASGDETGSQLLQRSSG
uniref:Uncharacterized protein n=1 Tax=Megaselia scalaris TaxID=36166 RepID=T1GHT0_MEGSC